MRISIKLSHLIYFIWGKTCCFKNQSFQNLADSILGFGLFARNLTYCLKRLVLKQQVFPRIDIPTLDSINSVWWGRGGFVYGRVTILAVYYLGNTNTWIFERYLDLFEIMLGFLKQY